MSGIHLFPDAAEQVAIAIERRLLPEILGGSGSSIGPTAAEQMHALAEALMRASLVGDTTLPLRVGDPLAERALTLLDERVA